MAFSHALELISSNFHNVTNLTLVSEASGAHFKLPTGTGIEQGTWAECRDPRDTSAWVVMIVMDDRQIFMGSRRSVMPAGELMRAIQSVTNKKVGATMIPIHRNERVVHEDCYLVHYLKRNLPRPPKPVERTRMAGFPVRGVTTEII